MNINKWIDKNTASLSGKTVAVTGSTGGIGRELCAYLARLGASLILLDRNTERSCAFADELVEKFGCSVECIRAELEDIDSVRESCEELLQSDVDIFIHNAGAYSIPRRICSTGYDNVFMINFVSPYYMIRRLLPTLRARQGRAVIVSSIAHNYVKSDPDNIDLSDVKKASLVYGNAKRYLTFSLYELFDGERDASLSVTHPGITFTNITAHYPKLIFAIIKYPMKMIFMKPKKAALSILRGLFEGCGKNEWIGPRIFDVWGYPRKRKLNTCARDESEYIFAAAEKIYSSICEARGMAEYNK